MMAAPPQTQDQLRGSYGYPDDEPEFHVNLHRWLDAVRRRWRLLAVVAGVVVLASVLLYALSPKLYRAATVIQVERKVAAPVNMDRVEGSSDSSWELQTFYSTQIRLLESRGLAERVVTDLRLADDGAFNPTRASLVRVGTRAQDAEADAEQTADLANRLLHGLSVTPVKNTRLIQIAYVARDADLAARVANGVAEAYINWGIDARGATVKRASSFLGTQIEAIKAEITDKEAQLNAYSKRTDIVALDPSSNVTLQRLETLNRDYSAAVSERINKEARYQHYLSAPKEAVAETLTEGLVTQLRTDLMKLEQEYASKLATFKPEWPAMQDLKAQIEKGRQNLGKVINETVEKAREEARSEYLLAQRREASLAAELDRQKAGALELNSAAVEYNNLKLEISARRALLDDLLRKQSEAEVAARLQGSRESNVVVVDRALRPKAAFRPSLKRNLALGLVLGLGLGLAVVFGLEYLDRTLKTSEDVERAVGLPVLGVIPDVSAAIHGQYGYYKKGNGPRPAADGATASLRPPRIELICARHPRLAVSEAYRSLRTALMLSSAEQLRVVVVTSATSGEGKTATAGNLALALSQLGQDVLLIDADLRKPRQHEVFRLSNRTGLVSFLTWQAEAEDAIQRLGTSSLHLATSGPIPPNPAELLASARMREFMAFARDRFDIVVIDSPPVLPVTDASVLAKLADGVAVCLAARTVTRDEASAAVEKLALVDARLLGAVLNRFQETGGHYSARTYYRQYETYIDESGPTERRAAGSKAG